MRLPITFPSDADVIAEEAARFRSLSPENRVCTLGEMFLLYRFLQQNSANPDAVAGLAREEEDCGRRAIEEFVARHV
jgi:hypothetical protein